MKCFCEPFQICEECSMIKPLLKPGKKPKNKPKYSKTKIHNIERSEERECVNCGLFTGTENYHHAEDSTIKFIDGGGVMGDKINGYLTAYLCNKEECGIKFDTKPDKNCSEIVRLRHDLFTASLIIKTWLLKDKK